MIAPSLRTELHRVRQLVDGGAGVASELPGLEQARARFNLAPFERDVLAVALAAELDPTFAEILTARFGSQRVRPRINDVLAMLAPSIVDTATAIAMLGPAGHLYRSGLIELAGDGPHGSREIRLAAAVWPLLIGADRLAPFPIDRPADGELARLALAPEMGRRCAELVAWSGARSCSELLVAIVGREGSGRHALARALAARLGFASLVVDGAAVSEDATVRAIARETAWHLAAPIVHGRAEVQAVCRLADEVSVPVFAIVSGEMARELAGASRRQVFELAIPQWTHVERAACWRVLLDGEACADDVDVGALGRRIRIGPGRIAAAVGLARTASATRRDNLIHHADLEAGCRLPDDGRAAALAATLERDVTLDDLVVAPATRRELDLIVAWARHGGSVFGPSGAGARARIGDGLVCLFAGPPGTGKTMAARALGRALELDVMRIDLAELVDKYIGETEKNVERVFTEAEARGAVVFFDEADAVFGKRTDIKDAHDRYANIGTSYLLQRIEDHPGVVVLATNRRPNLDGAFARRIHVVAEFAIPDARERGELWRRHVAPDHVAADVDLGMLAAKFVLTGSEIRNAVATAAVFGAAEGTGVTMTNLVIAVWRELRKAGRLVQADAFDRYRDVIVRYQRSGEPAPPH